MTDRDYNECVKLYADNVYRFILKNLKNEEDAKDVVQTSFEKIWVNRLQVDATKSKSYLFTVAYNAMIDLIRKNKRTVLKDDFGETLQGQVLPLTNQKRILQEALSKLNERDKSLIMLKDYEGYNYAEIGEITSLNESQVKVYIHRARLQLKAYIVKVENVI
jgi:RNA polymerase sigma factor (sigma-70 family)